MLPAAAGRVASLALMTSSQLTLQYLQLWSQPPLCCCSVKLWGLFSQLLQPVRGQLSILPLLGLARLHPLYRGQLYCAAQVRCRLSNLLSTAAGKRKDLSPALVTLGLGLLATGVQGQVGRRVWLVRLHHCSHGRASSTKILSSGPVNLQYPEYSQLLQLARGKVSSIAFMPLRLTLP